MKILASLSQIKVPIEGTEKPLNQCYHKSTCIVFSTIIRNAWSDNKSLTKQIKNFSFCLMSLILWTFDMSSLSRNKIGFGDNNMISYWCCKRQRFSHFKDVSTKFTNIPILFKLLSYSRIFRSTKFWADFKSDFSTHKPKEGLHFTLQMLQKKRLLMII